MLIPLPDGAVVRRIAPGRFERHYHAKYRAPVRKLAYFMLREGVGQALRKARSKRIERAIERAQEILVAGFELDGLPWIGLSRALTAPPRFDPRLVFPNPARLAPDAIVLTERALDLAESYLPIPSCPFPQELVAEIARANPALGSAGAPAPRTPSPPARATARATAPPGVYLIGFGGYVREYVLPHVRGAVRAAVDYKSDLIRRFADPGFPVHGDLDRLLDDVAVGEDPLVIISSYHSDHAAQAMRVLEANGRARVFIEKPAAVDPRDAVRLAELRGRGSWIDVGFNRRWAPLTARMRDELAHAPGPRRISMSVRELRIPTSHWYLWPNQGSRVTGNACHWIDLAHHLTGSEVVDVSAGPPGDEVALNLRFADGSHADLVMTDRGDDLAGVVEQIRIAGEGIDLTLDDYRRLTSVGPWGSRGYTRVRRDKGHAAMYRALVRRWRAGEGPVYPAADLVPVCAATHAAARLVAAGDPEGRLEGSRVGG